MARIGVLPCPHCGGELKFDLGDRKLHCKSCQKIWSYKMDLEKGEMVWHEWKSFELTEREIKEINKED